MASSSTVSGRSIVAATTRFTVKSLIAVSVTATAATAFMAATTTTTNDDHQHRHQISSSFQRRLNTPTKVYSPSSTAGASPSHSLLRLEAAAAAATPSPFPSWMARLFFNKNDDDSEEEDDEEDLSFNDAETITAVLQKRFQVGDSYVWLYKDKSGTPTSWEKYTVTDCDHNSYDDDQDNNNDNDNRHHDHYYVVTIEMSTKFEQDDAYSTHHRIKANLTDHVLNSQGSRDAWKIGFEYFDPSPPAAAATATAELKSESKSEGRWRKFGDGDNVQAFEEKFDVFSMMSSNNHTSSTVAVVNDEDEEAKAEALEELKVFPWTSTSTTTLTSQCDPKDHTRAVSLNTRTGIVAGKNHLGVIVNDLERNNVNLTRTDRHEYTEAWYGPKNHDTLSGIALYKEFPNSQHTFSLIEMTTRKRMTASTSTNTDTDTDTDTDIINVAV